jgi:formate dehydrogenase major subunit
LTENLLDQDFVSQRVDNLEAMRLQLRPWTPERAAAICGVSVDDIYAAARLYAAAKPAMCFHGLGVTEHTQGTEGVMCVVNLALLTGNLGKTGSGVNPLRGQNNVQGAAHMGCDPSILTGSVSIKNARERFATHWHSPISTVHGLNLMTMMDAAQAGKLKALYVIGYDVYLTLANAAETRKALEKLELVIVQDLFLNETAMHFGTVFLPAAATYEKDGTFMNSERRVQRVRRVVDAPGGCKADWEIICELGRRLGKPEQFAFLSPEAIWDEVRALWPDGAGMSYARLERGGLQWPCRTEQDPGTSLLHVTTFSAGEAASLRAVEFHPTTEMTDEAYPILLTTGRSLYQFNAGTMSGCGGTLALRPLDTLDLAPADADRLNLANGATARVTSRHGKVELPVRVLSSIQPGQAFATFHNAASFLNELTSSCRDSIVQAPEYKVTAVHVQLAAPHQNDSQADLAVTRAPYDNPAQPGSAGQHTTRGFP